MKADTIIQNGKKLLIDILDTLKYCKRIRCIKQIPLCFCGELKKESDAFTTVGVVMKILVTGFDPFGGEKINPALETIISGITHALEAIVERSSDIKVSGGKIC